MNFVQVFYEHVNLEDSEFNFLIVGMNRPPRIGSRKLVHAPTGRVRWTDATEVVPFSSRLMSMA